MNIVENFLKAHPEFTIEHAGGFVTEKVVNKEGCIELFPHIHNTDGAFSARLVRKN